jgi:alpha-beta hydrolase superfamily lysophospholipase
MGCGVSTAAVSTIHHEAGTDTTPRGYLPQTNRSLQQDDGEESILLDKVIVRLEYALVPNLDTISQTDTKVTVSLIDTREWPQTFFGCSALPDHRDLLELTTHTFSEKTNTLNPVWHEEVMLLAYRPSMDAPLQGRLRVAACDVDVGKKNDVLLSGYDIDVWELLEQQSSSAGRWIRVEIPLDCPEADPKLHRVVLSLFPERAEQRIVSRADVDNAGMEEHVISLSKGDLSGGGRAVVVYRSLPHHEKVFFWMPGLNAAFHHVHVMNALLAAGWDVFSVDCRRMGRSKRFSREHDPNWNPLDAHSTASFEEYCEEIDAMIQFATQLKEERKKDSGCGGSYRYRVLYGNSTGALTCTTYLRCGGALAGTLDGLALNGPFFDWNLAAYAELLMSSATLTDIYAKLVVGNSGRNVQEGEGVSAYALRIWSQFYFDVSKASFGDLPPGLRSIANLNTTAEWAKAVTMAQKAIRAKENHGRFHKPIFIISSVSDAWVSSEESLTIVDCIGPVRTEIQVYNAEHDVFLSTTRAKCDECIQHLLTWLASYFP